MKKFFVISFMVMTMFVMFGVQVFANVPAPGVEVFGASVNFADQHPAIVDGRTLVPIRAVFEKLGFSIAYVNNDGSIQVTLTRATDTVVVTTGSPVFTTNGVSHDLDVPAQIIGGRTLLPIRAVVESVGYGVLWDEGANLVSIVRPPSFATLPTQQNRHITPDELETWIAAYNYLGGINEFEREVLRLTNIERANHGVSPLSFNYTLAMSARFKSQSMSNLNYMAHTSPVYGDFYVISESVFGMGVFGGAMAENIAFGQRTPQEVVDGWMNSPGHRRNILYQSYTQIGIGFYNNRWTQKFR
ncbi:MAG: stalk domain-containing protein [Defluviitaleaceae bacterium]|nr:stalk domain-containing protein [Defluviitaleaceae bacterium]